MRLPKKAIPPTDVHMSYLIISSSPGAWFMYASGLLKVLWPAVKWPSVGGRAGAGVRRLPRKSIAPDPFVVFSRGNSLNNRCTIDKQPTKWAEKRRCETKSREGLQAWDVKGGLADFAGIIP